DYYRTVPDSRFRNQMYVYVGDIPDTWRTKQFNVTVFQETNAVLGTSGKLSEDTFKKRFGTATTSKWTMRPRTLGSALQFTYGGTPYLLTLMDVRTVSGEHDSVSLQVCEKR